MEPEKDFVLVRDGETAKDLELAKLTGKLEDNKQVSTAKHTHLFVQFAGYFINF